MIIQKSDFTDYAINLGTWQILCEMAGINPEQTEEIEIITVKKTD